MLAKSEKASKPELPKKNSPDMLVSMPKGDAKCTRFEIFKDEKGGLVRQLPNCVSPHGDFLNSIYRGDAGFVLKQFPAGTVHLVVTSPPYADARKKTYGGIPADKYVEWMTPITAELFRILHPKGSFILNIKERVINGERSTYVLELIQALRKQGWLWTEEYIWHKKNCYPGKWPNRFRDAWERCLHFTKRRDFAMYQDEVRVPMGQWRHARLKNLSETDRVRDESKVRSGFGKKIENWIGRDVAYPTNVLQLATECGNKSHSAAFPEALPEWFIKLFTQQGDTVLDPFSGSGTTGVAAARMGRNFIVIDVVKEYCRLAAESLDGLKVSAPDSMQPTSADAK